MTNPSRNVMLGNIIRSVRAQHLLTQREAAEACGVSPGMISCLENGGINKSTGLPIDVRDDTLSKIARGLGLTMEELKRHCNYI